MPKVSEGKAGRDDQESCLVFSLQAEASHLQASDNRAIPFTRPILKIRNVCDTELGNIVPHVTLGQEGGTVQDISSHLFQSASASLPPGGIISWDVYDLLLSAHPGAASKIHMFGYRAALNWKFDLAAWFEYCFPGPTAPDRTPLSRWTLQWSAATVSPGEVVLAIEELNI